MKNIINFLTQLKENNTRDWFHANKDIYNEAKERFDTYINLLIPKVKEIDSGVDVNEAKECTFRIYRDVRFSKNKEPYKTNFGGYINKGGRKSKYAGYYLHVEPDNSFIGGGIYMPQGDDLRSIREEIHKDPETFKKLLNDKEFKEYFPELWGDKLKTAPRGFPKDFADIDLLRYKSYTVLHYIKDSDLFSDHFFDYVIEVFNVQYKFNKYFNDIYG
ncbi:MAG: DUF2461 domain-containing protein [bacterium]|nr:DUF2461 domain-containing protein [bacterium]